MALHARCKCKIRFHNKRSLETALNALKPEMQKPLTFRSKANLEVKNNCLILNIEAKDTVAMRAALNAYLRWINSIMTILDLLKLQ